MVKKYIKLIFGLFIIAAAICSGYVIRFLLTDFHITYIRLVLLSNVCLMTGYLMFFFNITHNDVISAVISRLRKNHLLYLIEVVLFGFFLACLIPFLYELHYVKTISFPLFIGTITTCSIFFWYLLNLLLTFSKDPAELFVSLAIPFCMVYCFMIVPNGVPDEPQHFGKAYLTSTGIFTNDYGYSVPNVYDAFKEHYYRYDQMFKLLVSKTNYSNTVVNGEILQTNCFYYLLPAFGLFLGRLSGLSLMLSFIVGRMMNAFFYIFVGFNTVKKTPIGKYVFLLYMLNPVCLQQAASMSPDSFVNVFCIYSIAYILDLAMNEKAIQYRDILLLGIIMVVVTVLKPNYILIYGLLLLCWKQLIKMNFPKWALVCFMLALIPIVRYGNSLLIGIDNYTTEIDSYVIDNGINQGQQLRFLLNDPLFVIQLIQNTMMHYGRFYLESYSGVLMSWFNIYLPYWVAFGYQGLIISSACLTSTGRCLKWKEKGWCLVLSIFLTVSIILGLYVTWTPVGASFAEGVQGRYFIPFLILPILMLVGKKKTVSDYSGVIYSVLAIVFQCCAMYLIFLQYL